MSVLHILTSQRGNSSVGNLSASEWGCSWLGMEGRCGGCVGGGGCPVSVRAETAIKYAHSQRSVETVSPLHCLHPGLTEK